MDPRLRFAVGMLAAWRVSHLVHAEDGPGDIVVRLRQAAGTSLVGRAMDCFNCISLWAAAPLALAVGEGWAERAMLWPALSAAAVLIEQLIPEEHHDQEEGA